MPVGRRTENSARRQWPLRALLIGTALTIATGYWALFVDDIAQGDAWTGASLMRGPLFVLFCVVLVNLVVRALRPRLGLTQAELIIIYTMTLMGAAINGVGMLSELVPALTAFTYHADAFNFARFLPYAPQHLFIHDKQAVDAFWQGGHSVWEPTILRAWARPVLWWSSFIFAFILAMVCIQVLVRRQWLEHERLVFPLSYVPLAMTEDGGGGIKRNKLFWAGFAIVAIAQAVNGISFYFPAIPSVQLRQVPLEYLQRVWPWSGMGGVVLACNPFLIAIAYFVNLDVSLSIWLFYLLFKLVELIFVVYTLEVPVLLGGKPIGLLPFMDDQGIGAFIGLTLILVWTGRRRLAEMWRMALRSGERHPEEMMSYRVSFAGMVASVIFMGWFIVRMGISPLYAIPALCIMFTYAIGLSRLVAEAGYAYYTPEAGGGRTVLLVAGPKNVFIRDQVAFGFLASIDQFYHDNPSPQQINAIKLGEQAKVSPRHILLAIVAGALIGLAADWWAQLSIYYKYGAGTGKFPISWTPPGTWYLRFMGNFYDAHAAPDRGLIQAILVGIVAVAALAKLRSVFFWFPLHPAGYIISGTPAARFVWMPFLVGWFIKLVVVHYGGLRLYRKWTPFFLGVIVGDVVTPALFSVFGAVTGQPVYQFFP